MVRRILLILLIALLAVACDPRQADATRMYPSNADHRVLLRVLDGDLEFTGTAWYTYTHGEYSVVMTAAHVCDAAKDETSGRFVVLEDYRGEYILGMIESMNSSEDVCSLVVLSRAENVIQIADNELSSYPFGTKVWTMGFPNGDLSIFDGRFSGIEESEDGSGVQYSRFSMPDYFGGSGSPVLSRGRVVSVFVRVLPSFPLITLGTSTRSMRIARDRAIEELRVLESIGSAG